MPRIRTIKPDFFTSDTVSVLPLRARLTWIGLWTHCDDHGRCRDNVKLIKAAVWPLDDVSLRDIESDLDDLEKANVVYRYTAEGKSYIQVTNWSEHQKVDRPSKSTIPAPPDGPAPARQYAREPRGTADIHSTNVDASADPAPAGRQEAAEPVDNSAAPASSQASAGTDDTRESLASAREHASNPRDRKGKEWRGKEGKVVASQQRAQPPATTGPSPEPPSQCEEHQGNPNPPPCGPCGDARRAHAKWEADRRTRIDQAAKCRLHRGQPAHNCAGCRADRLAADAA